MEQVYSLTKIFFSIKDKQIQSGKLELTSEPTTRAVSSTEDMGLPVVSFRDPKTITFIFNVEVTIGSYDYKLLTDMSQNQFYNVEESTHKKLLKLVFNDLESVTLYLIMHSLQKNHQEAMLLKQKKLRLKLELLIAK
ncbi:putative cytosolic protein [Borrelia duttonii CR2A]|uniref:Putative cytosolic protein n=1 Tax=Borrelia duttonii CR2A TaxID=1432657 RepID=W6TGB0_9SPIR|nr:putative cytosolic protein [Borrelia duttonii CR2A]